MLIVQADDGKLLNVFCMGARTSCKHMLRHRVYVLGCLADGFLSATL
jgi:hypothetical protein